MSHGHGADVYELELSHCSGTGRRLTAATGTRRSPLRIVFNTTAVTSATQATLLSAAQRTLITNNALVDANTILRSALRVDSVVGNLYASRTCTSAYTTGVCAVYSSSLPTCGVNPSLTIPQSMVAAAYSSCTSSANVGHVWSCFVGHVTVSLSPPPL